MHNKKWVSSKVPDPYTCPALALGTRCKTICPDVINKDHHIAGDWNFPSLGQHLLGATYLRTVSHFHSFDLLILKLTLLEHPNKSILSDRFLRTFEHLSNSEHS